MSYPQGFPRFGSWALSALLICLGLSLTAEFWIGSRPLLVRHQGQWISPVLSSHTPGALVGQTDQWEADWNRFAQEAENTGDLLFMPLIPWGPDTIDLSEAPPSPPTASSQHWLGTDSAGRDVLARLVYGFRIGFGLAFIVCLGSFSVASIFALLSASGPSWLDLVAQRFLEVWSHLPFLYVLIGIQSLFPEGGALLLISLMVLFSWTQLSLTLRAQMLAVLSSDAHAMTKVLGFSKLRVALTHLLPHLYPIFASLFPFALASTLSSFTALDTLGFALPSDWPTWGELLQQGLHHTEAPWLTIPILLGLIVILTLTSLIGEASRKAIHPRRVNGFR